MLPSQPATDASPLTMSQASTHRRASVERVGDGIHMLGESPVWCAREQALYWVDLRAPALHRWTPMAHRPDVWPMAELIGAVVVARRGSLLLALESGVYRFDPATGERSFLVAPEAAQGGNRMNDTKTDRCGCLWASTMRDFGADATGSLYRIDPALEVERMLTGIRVPNALAWSPDDRTMYFADTSDGRLRAHDFDCEAGRLGGMRILVEAGVLPGKPDGATVDADGCIRSARYRGGCVARVTPRGALDRLIELPVSQPTSCAFGDADLRTLYITSARQQLSEAQLRIEPFAGALFAVRLDVGGLPEPECAL